MIKQKIYFGKKCYFFPYLWPTVSLAGSTSIALLSGQGCSTKPP